MSRHQERERGDGDDKGRKAMRKIIGERKKKTAKRDTNGRVPFGMVDCAR